MSRTISQMRIMRTLMSEKGRLTLKTLNTMKSEYLGILLFLLVVKGVYEGYFWKFLGGLSLCID